ncbi:MAG TPA: extracellular solute-binding protein [Clostridiales bacterium]|nr:extracellular solute-binding protein [Clostridiales bacterium]
MVKCFLRILSLISCCLMLFALVSCGKTEGKSDTGSKDSDNLSELDKVAREIADSYAGFDLPKINDGKPVTIKVHLGDIIPTLSEIPTAEQPDVFNSTEILRRAFMMLFPNVTVEWARTVDTSSSDAFLQYITTQLNSGTAPDIVSAWGASFAYRGWYYDFTEVLEKPNPFVKDNKRWRDQFPEYVFATWQVSDAKDRVVAIPVSLAAGTSTALYYNKELFSKLSINAPKTWEDLFTACKTLLGNGYISFSPWGGPGSGNRKISTTLWDVQFSLGPYYAAKQKDKLDYNGDGIQSQSELFRAAYEGHYFVSTNDYVWDMWKQVKRKYTTCLEKGYENSDYETKWLLGKVGILEDGLWRYPSELSNTDRQFEFGIIPPPAIDTDSTEFVDKLEYTESGPYRPVPRASFNIIKDSAMAHGGEGNIQACVAFLQFLTQPDNNNMIINEEKGKSISIIKGSKVPPQLTEYFKQPFPKTPSFSWPGGFTNAGAEKMSKILELWVKDQISDSEFKKQFDDEFKKDIMEFVQLMQIDTSQYKKGF